MTKERQGRLEHEQNGHGMGTRSKCKAGWRHRAATARKRGIGILSGCTCQAHHQRGPTGRQQARRWDRLRSTCEHSQWKRASRSSLRALHGHTPLTKKPQSEVVCCGSLMLKWSPRGDPSTVTRWTINRPVTRPVSKCPNDAEKQSEAVRLWKVLPPRERIRWPQAIEAEHGHAGPISKLLSARAREITSAPA